jgi:hypothetical protein
MNPFECNVDWKAVATLCAGLAAVGSALWIATKQNELRRNEIRLSLLKDRRKLLIKIKKFQHFRAINYKDAEGQLSKFDSIIVDIELLHNQKIVDVANDIRDRIFQQCRFQGISTNGSELAKTNAINLCSDAIDYISDNLPKLITKIRASSKIDIVFQGDL